MAVVRLLAPVDPVRGLAALAADAERLRELDPRVREAAALVEDRLSGLSDEERDGTLAPMLWLGLRARVASPPALDALRRSLRDGASVLHAVDTALAAPAFGADVLRRAVRESDATHRAALDEARVELDRLRSGRDSTILALAIDLAIAAALAEAAAAERHLTHHH